MPVFWEEPYCRHTLRVATPSVHQSLRYMTMIVVGLGILGRCNPRPSLIISLFFTMECTLIWKNLSLFFTASLSLLLLAYSSAYFFCSSVNSVCNPSFLPAHGLFLFFINQVSLAGFWSSTLLRFSSWPLASSFSVSFFSIFLFFCSCCGML